MIITLGSVKYATHCVTRWQAPKGSPYGKRVGIEVEITRWVEPPTWNYGGPPIKAQPCQVVYREVRKFRTERQAAEWAAGWCLDHWWQYGCAGLPDAALAPATTDPQEVTQ